MGRKFLEDPRFTVHAVSRERGGITYFVRGFTRAGERVREQMQTLEHARARANELESQWIGKEVGAAMRLTRLTTRELSLAESAFLLLSEPEELKAAVAFYLEFGAGHKGKGKLPTLADAHAQFLAWLDSDECDLRPQSKSSLRIDTCLFAEAAGPIGMADLTPDLIDDTLRRRWPDQPTSRHNARRCISRFASWCMLRPRRWLASNPASSKLVQTKPSYAMSDAEPEIFTLRQVMRLLGAARRYQGGKFLRFIVLSLFAGLRPTEALRIRPDQVRMDEGELRMDGGQTKTGTSRTILLPDVAVAWLKVCPAGKTFDWTRSRLQWEKFKTMAKIRSWPHDGLRHTAISYYFRACGSYGLTAEWAGNSEGVIKKHYQGRVSSAESDVYWNLYPVRWDRLRAIRKLKGQITAEPSNVIRAFGRPAPRTTLKARKAG